VRLAAWGPDGAVEQAAATRATTSGLTDMAP